YLARIEDKQKQSTATDTPHAHCRVLWLEQDRARRQPNACRRNQRARQDGARSSSHPTLATLIPRTSITHSAVPTPPRTPDPPLLQWEEPAKYSGRADARLRREEIGPKVCRKAQRNIGSSRILAPEELERRQLPRSLAVATPHARRL